LARIAEATARAGRPENSVRLIAVSKKMPADDVRAALAAGQRDFGENYAQELRDKRAAFQELPVTTAAITASGVATTVSKNEPEVDASRHIQPRWHYLGPIQNNKVKYLAAQVALIHSLDDAAILGEIDRRAAAAQPGAGGRQACLVQVNIAGEARKGGVPPHKLSTLLDCFATTTHATCTGLMLIPPMTGDAVATRGHFAALRALAEREQAIPRPNVSLAELSMGMSGDFVEAIAEGATMVRVGTAIFGARPAR
jgi:hypothetical protein